MKIMDSPGSKRSVAISLAFASLVLIAGCDLHLIDVVFNPVQKPVNMIYDDDCDGDIDCAVTQPIIHNWIDLGYIKMWAMVSSASTQLGAPTMKVFRHYYGHDGSFSIGALTPSCGLSQSAAWNVAVVEEFDPGDVCANYAGCGTVLRQAVANYIAGGGKANDLDYVITGPLSCEEQFRTSPPDEISSLTGVQMEQQFIKEFVLMNGFAPTGTEPNCVWNPSACSAFFTNVTSQNGYPPVYVVPINTGAYSVVTEVPVTSLPMSNPTAYAYNSADRSNTADEDALAVEYAVFGSTGWTLSPNSKDTVSAGTGENSWSSVPSGQYFLTTAISPVYFEIQLQNPWLPIETSENAAASPR